MTNQPTLFDANGEKAEIERVLLYALGEFQARKKVLAGRELPLDRLRGAFKRAAEKFQIDEYTDRQLAENLKKMGAEVEEVPSYVAKHPYRVTVSEKLAEKSSEYYKESIAND